ncbi:pilus assembly protein TadG-related protein [Achromobacter xylosoxidans]
MSTRSIRYVPRSRQRGSMTVAVVFAVLVGMVLLGVAQLGYGYYMKREVQKAADLAALSACRCWARAPRRIAAAPRRRACRRRWPICRISWTPFPR